MKNSLCFLTLAFSLCVAHVAPAAVPSAINYQGRLTNTAGVPQTGIKSMSIKIYDATADGTLLYSESVGNVTIDANGVYGFQFGANGAGTPPNISTALAAATEQWLELTVDGTAQAPRLKILAVPYALMAGGLPDGAVSSSMIADGAIGVSKITGLGTAATAASTDFATAAQGAKADTAVQAPLGPYADEYAAAAGGVVAGGVYKALGGALNWRQTPQGASIALMGDSITAQGSSGLTQLLSSGYATSARVMSGSRWDPMPNGAAFHFATSGARTDQISANHLANLIAANPDFMIDACGINDVAQSVPNATIVASRLNIWNQCRAAGVWPIACEILPFTATYAGNSGGVVSARVVSANLALKAAALANHVPWVEWSSAIELSPGLGTTLYQPDNIHPNDRGAWRIGRVLAATLKNLAVFTVDPFANANWITPNLPFSGTTTPAGWNAWPASGGSLGTQSVIAASDGLGSWWQVPLVKGSSIGAFYLTNSSSNIGGSPADKTVDGVCEIKVISGIAAPTLQVYANPSVQGQVYDMHAGAGISELQPSDGAVVLRTPVRILASDRTVVWPQLVVTPVGGDVIIQVRRIGIRQYP